MSSRTKLSGAGLSEMHPSTIEVSGTTTAERSGSSMEPAAAEMTAAGKTAAAEVATSAESAASKSAPSAPGPCRIT